MVPVPLTSEHLTVPHGFFGREGGTSTGIFRGLNVGLGSTDDRAAVAENRRRAVAAVLPGAALATLHQIHSAEAAIATGGIADDARPHADALATDRPGLLLGVLAADCAPVLLADAAAGVVGAAHAGWKGALHGVTDAAIAAMETLGARRERIVAVVGPCIRRASYEVDDAFRARLEAADPATKHFFSGGARAGRHQYDNEGYVLHRLAAAGIFRVAALGLDTYPDEARFFSYRRATHRAEPDYGRQISLIGIEG